MRNSTVRTVNGLTRRWARSLGSGDSTVFTAAGLWPLLALLADGAEGPARDELADALGIPAGEAAATARELFQGLAGIGGLETALGLWTRAALPLRERWAAGLPEGTRGTLTGVPDTDRAALDTWAKERTGGLIEKMPVTDPAAALMVLASALALDVSWLHAFEPVPQRPADGPWAGRTVAGLYRLTSSLDRVGVARTPAGPLTVLQVGGEAGVDVHLVRAPEEVPAGEALALGLDVSTGVIPALPGDLLPEGTPGPGVTVGIVEAFSPTPSLEVSTVAFEVSAEHDLTERAQLFGLATALRDGDHFPGISAEPLAVGEARQSARAEFHAEGFRAAAVTAIAMRPGGGPPPARHRVRRIRVAFDRPFGFLAVHRASGLVLAAGRVAEPLPFPQRRPAPGGVMRMP
ncbi:serpin family protein [Streptomyces sp. NPDC101118]|uniref:serpin family protein n=1 Tax=Streptomyces sp. NPDC101118 TaxID=3366109 RepID=UPI0038266213